MSGPAGTFTYQALPVRVVFGPGSVAGIAEEVDRLDLRRVMVLSTPGHAGLAGTVADLLAHRAVGVCPHAAMHVPAEVARTAVHAVREAGADGCVAVGGGSTIGLAKAVALECGLPVLAVPTTYSGSEMTTVWGRTEDGVKRTGRDPRVLPRTVVYDPELTLSLPPRLSATSGLNALAHAVEALYAPDTNPVVELLAADAVRGLAAALPLVVAVPDDLDARTAALRGAWLAGSCLGVTTMSLHHRLCHALGGSVGLPHAETHAVVLPHVLAYNAPAAPRALEVLRQALGGVAPATEVWELGGRLGVPLSLRELGMRHEQIEPVVEQVMATPYANPREVTEAGLRAVLQDAFDGTPPAGR